MEELKYVKISAFVVLAFATVASGFQPLRCTVCQGVRHLSYCDKATICDGTTQVCFVSKVMNSVGVTRVEAGCKNKTDCDSTGCFGESQGANANRRVRRAVPAATTGSGTGNGTGSGQSETLLCHHCCDTDFCNMYGCHDTFDLDSLKGQRRCFSCDLTQELEHCMKTVNCDPGETCYVQKLSLGGDRWYSSGCVKEAMCDLLSARHSVHGDRRKRQAVPLWSDCCRNHMCNGHLAMDQAPPSRDSNNYKCPALQPPAVATLQPNISGVMECYTCHHASSLDDCKEVEYCTPDEICYMEIAASRSKKVYTLGCEKKGMCAMLTQTRLQTGGHRKKRSYTPVWSECCDSQLCNKQLGTTAPPSQPLVCEDLYTDCNLYTAEHLCEGESEAWARVNCRKYCGYCNDETTTTTTTPSPTTAAPQVCKNKFDTCAHFTPTYICEGSNERFGRLNCAEYCGHCTGATTPPPVPTTDAPQECINKFPTCADYPTQYICEGENEAWGRDNCEEYCGVCTASNAASRQDCRDLDLGCASYGYDYICTRPEFQSWAELHCPKFCGMCTNGSTTAMPTGPGSHVCRDVDSDCDTYGRSYICTPVFEPWAKIHCAKYCGICGATTTESSTSTTTTTTPTTTTTTTTPTTTTTTTTTPTTANSSTAISTHQAPVNHGCMDVDPDCDTYGRDYICAKAYEPWANLHCAKYCHLCTEETTTPPPTSAPCVDQDPDCDTYGHDYICAVDYHPWAKIHCAKYCGICTGATAQVTTSTPTTSTTKPTMKTTTPTTTSTTSTTTTATTTTTPASVTSGQCVDVDPDCDTYGFDYICAPDYKPWASLHCAMYCKLCTQETTTPPPTSAPCVDQDPDCNTYGHDYICAADYHPWAKIHCAKYCGLCTTGR